ncbi:MAG: Rpn family recombination-promoting nuclease/putative transposase [Eubacterium sp.]|nr:Rpn family recombination-promoting nuclease/putative transposase [Eubacterium sp.]
MEKNNDNQILLNDYQTEDLEKKWLSLGIGNDFIFSKVMLDESMLKELVQMILPDVKISHLEVQTQKTVEIGLDIHGVRFDVFAIDREGPAFTVEMQMLNKRNLPKRIRYYLSIADTQLLEKSVDYEKLSDSYVILICPFDLFEAGLHKYTFTYRCEEDTDIGLKDGTKSIILNAVGTADDIDERLKAFLDYVVGKPSEDDYVRRLDMAVKEAKMNGAWRREYIVAMQHDIEKIREGREEGMDEIVEVITALKNGKSKEQLVAEGYQQSTIDKAMQCL